MGGVMNSSAPMNARITFERVNITRSWGEAIDPLLAEDVTISDCTLRDVYSVGIYLDNSRRVTVDRSLVDLSNASFYRNYDDPTYEAAGSCVALGTEAWYPRLIDVEDVNISSNLCLNGSRGVGGFSMGKAMRRVRVIGNTFWGLSVYGVAIPDQAGEARGNVLQNNLIHMASIPGISRLGTPALVTTLDLPSWMVSANAWAGSNTSRLPLDDTASSSQPSKPLGPTVSPGTLFAWTTRANGSCYRTPSGAAASDLTFTPHVHTSGAAASDGGATHSSSRTSTSETRADCYKPALHGALADAGSSLTGGWGSSTSGTDYFGSHRNPRKPTIGFAEVADSARGRSIDLATAQHNMQDLRAMQPS